MDPTIDRATEVGTIAVREGDRVRSERHIEDGTIHDILSVPDGLPEELVRVLAHLHGMPRSFIDAFVTNLPFGSRATLVAYGLIGEAPKTQSRTFYVTRRGHEVIEAARSACSDSTLPNSPEKRQAVRTNDSVRDALLTPGEVAALFRVDPVTVTRWAKAGKLTTIRTLGGHFRYREHEVREYLSEIRKASGDV